MKVISGITFASSVQGSLSALGVDGGLLFGGKKSASASGDSWMKTPEAIETVIKDALDRNAKPIRSEYQFRPLVLDDWDKDKDSILVMVNEAAHNFKFVKYVVDFELPGKHVRSEPGKKKLEILQDLTNYSKQVLTLVKQKLFELVSKGSLSVLPKRRYIKNVQNTQISKHDLSRGIHKISEVEKAMGSMQHVRKQENLGFSGSYGNRHKKWPELGSDPKGLGEPLLGIKFSEYSSSDQGYEDSSSQAGTFLNQIIVEQGIVSGFKDCLLEVTFQKSVIKNRETLPEFWLELFKKAVFQEIEFLFKYRFIGSEEISHFYEAQPDILEMAGEHIGTMHAGKDGTFRFPCKPDATYQMMDCKLDYMRHSIIGLNENSQRKLIHAAQSLSRPVEISGFGWQVAPPHSNAIYSFIINKDFLGQLSNWSLNIEDCGKDEELTNNLSKLIHNFLNPPKTLRSPYGASLIPGYQFTVFMLDYILQNMSDHESISEICHANMIEYKQFMNRFNLIVAGRRLQCLYLRWSQYIDFMRCRNEGVISRKQVEREITLLEEELKLIGNKYSQLRDDLNNSEDHLPWRDNRVVERIIGSYSACLPEI